VTHGSVGPSYVRGVPSEDSRGTAVIWVIAALVAVFAAVRLTGSSHHDGGSAPVRIDRSPAATEPDHQEAAIYVHVAGAVRQPGLLKLPSGSRVATAVRRAGGPAPRADLSGVNLAARLEDGQQVLVPVRGAVAAAGAGAPGAVPGATGLGAAPPGAAGVPKASLGSATVEQLDQIDGIGPTLAQRIVEYRTEHGGFRSIGELREVEGIGEKRFETLRDALQP
jgi:competence protein ComEA